MIELLLFIILMGLLDSLNPFSIGLQIALLPLTKKIHHSLYYILGTFVTYFGGGLLIYFGVSMIVVQFFTSINIDFTHSPYTYIELILGTGLFGLAIFNSLKKANEKEKEKKGISVKPFALFALGASGTIFDLPTAIPYLAVLGKMATMKLDFVIIIVLLVFYCVIYLLPMIVVYIVYSLLRQKAERLIKQIKSKFDKISRGAAIAFSYIIAIFLIIDALLSISGNPIKY